MSDVNTGEVKTKSFERSVLDQDMINVIESQVEQRGSIDAVREHYQRVEKEEPRFLEDARAILQSIDVYKKGFLNKPPA